jgi:hypothetical protein
MGYKKPPKQTQFKPGTSGNPKGRPKKLPGIDALLTEMLGNEDGVITNKSGVRQIIQALFKRAIRGDVKAADIILNRAYGKVKDNLKVEAVVTGGFDFTTLSSEDLARVIEIVEKYENEHKQ